MISLPLVIRYVKPLYMLMNPRETMKGSSFVREMMNPMSTWKSTATTIPNSTATHSFRATTLIMKAMPVPMKHIIWPIDRSMPPDTMTIVMAMARIPVVETCISTLEMFLGLMKATLPKSKFLTKMSSARNTATRTATRVRRIGVFSRRMVVLSLISPDSLLRTSGWFPD